MARLGFVRIKCYNMNWTWNFYCGCLGLEVKRRAELDGGSTAYTYFGQPGNAMSLTLRFECEKFKQLKFSKQAKVPICATTMLRLVFYVQNIHDIILSVKNSDTGAWVYSLPQRHSDVSIALVVDPNGIMIQLVQLSDVHLQLVGPNGRAVENFTFQGLATKLGYASINSRNATEQAKFYQSLFKDTLEFEDLPQSSSGTREQSTRKGLRIVDKEAFPELMANYVWLGNAPRSRSATLCFWNKVERPGTQVQRLYHGKNALRKVSNQEGEEQNKEEEQEKESVSARRCFQMLTQEKTAAKGDPFLGLGIYVKDIERTVDNLKRNFEYPVRFIQEVMHAEAVGLSAVLLDDNDIHVQLVDEDTCSIQEASLQEKPSHTARREQGSRRGKVYQTRVDRLTSS